MTPFHRCPDIYSTNLSDKSTIIIKLKHQKIAFFYKI